MGRFLRDRMTLLFQTDCDQRLRARGGRGVDGGGSKADEPSSRKNAAQDLHSRDDGNHAHIRNVKRIKRHNAPCTPSCNNCAIIWMAAWNKPFISSNLLQRGYSEEIFRAGKRVWNRP